MNDPRDDPGDAGALLAAAQALLARLVARAASGGLPAAAVGLNGLHVEIVVGPCPAGPARPAHAPPLRPKEQRLLEAAGAEPLSRKQLILRAGYPYNPDSREAVAHLLRLGLLVEVGRRVRRAPGAFSPPEPSRQGVP